MPNDHTIQEDKRFRALIENSWDVIILVNRKAKILYSTPSIIRIFGREYTEFMGLSGIKFIHPLDAPKVLKALYHLIRKPSMTQNLEFRVLHRDGYYKWVEVIGTNMLKVPEVK